LGFAVPLPHNTHKVGRSQLARKSAALAGISESLFLAFGVALYEYEYRRQRSSPAIRSNLSLTQITIMARKIRRRYPNEIQRLLLYWAEQELLQ
jgi:hypothetical protein